MLRASCLFEMSMNGASAVFFGVGRKGAGFGPERRTRRIRIDRDARTMEVRTNVRGRGGGVGWWVTSKGVCRRGGFNEYFI